MPESEKRTYESLSKELAICYMKSGIAATAIPLLGIYEQRAEQHLAQIDDERKDLYSVFPKSKQKIKTMRC